MPRNFVLRTAAEWLQDLATFCTVAKPALFTVAEFMLYMVGLATVVGLVIRGH
jgi:hypothetical protein